MAAGFWWGLAGLQLILVTLPAAKAKTPDPLAWYQSVIKRPLAVFVPRTLLVTQGLSGGVPSSFEWDQGADSAIERQTFLRVLGKDEIRMYYEINQAEQNSKMLLPISNWYQELAGVLDLDFIVLARSKTWRLMIHAPHQKSTFVDVPMNNHPIVDEDTILKELTDTIGYSGVVLDYQDSLFLIAEYLAVVEKTQALIFRDSEKEVILPKDKPKGAALIERVSGRAGLGIYKVLLAQVAEKSIIQGSKVVIQGSQAEKF